MGTTFVNIESKGFWMNDGVLELWLRLASLHFDDACDKDTKAHQVREQWLLASQGYFTGCEKTKEDRQDIGHFLQPIQTVA